MSFSFSCTSTMSLRAATPARAAIRSSTSSRMDSACYTGGAVEREDADVARAEPVRRRDGPAETGQFVLVASAMSTLPIGEAIAETAMPRF